MNKVFENPRRIVQACHNWQGPHYHRRTVPLPGTDEIGDWCEMTMSKVKAEHANEVIEMKAPEEQP